MTAIPRYQDITAGSQRADYYRFHNGEKATLAILRR